MVLLTLAPSQSTGFHGHGTAMPLLGFSGVHIMQNAEYIHLSFPYFFFVYFPPIFPFSLFSFFVLLSSHFPFFPFSFYFPPIFVLLSSHFPFFPFSFTFLPFSLFSFFVLLSSHFPIFPFFLFRFTFLPFSLFFFFSFSLYFFLLTIILVTQ